MGDELIAEITECMKTPFMSIMFLLILGILFLFGKLKSGEKGRVNDGA